MDVIADFIIATESQAVEYSRSQAGVPSSDLLEANGVSMFAARRALPCWELYCDDEQPIWTVAALESLLVAEKSSRSWDEFTQPALPRFLGLRIDDCRECDTACAADSAAWAAQFVSSGDVSYAAGVLNCANGAFEQSPLGGREQFRRWLVDVAVPAAWDCRQLSPAERKTFRGFDEEHVRLHKWGPARIRIRKILQRVRSFFGGKKGNVPE